MREDEEDFDRFENFDEDDYEELRQSRMADCRCGAFNWHPIRGYEQIADCVC